MTLTASIIRRAYRESNILAAGQEPTPNQQSEGMEELTSLIDAVFGWDVGEELSDWMIGYEGQYRPDIGWDAEDWSHPIPNSRLLLNHNSTQTIYMPAMPTNGSRIAAVDVNSALDTYPVTLNGNGRLIDGSPTALLDVAGTNRTWMYHDDSADWRTVTGLTVTDQMPFPAAFDTYFIIKLATRVNPRFGRSLNDLSLAQLRESQEQLEARYRQTRAMPARGAVRRLTDPQDRTYSDDRRTGRWGWMR